MVVPREHGAWGMLLVPLATGAVVATKLDVNSSGPMLFVAAATSLFWLRTPVESRLETSPIKVHSPAERAFVQRTILAIGSLVALSAIGLLWSGRNRGLLIIGVIVTAAFAAQAAVKKLGRKGRMPAQVIGAAGLTSTAAGAYYVATGRLDHTAIALWAANWLFAADQVHFVQLRIHASRAACFDEKIRQGLPFLLAQVGLIGVLLTACRFGFFPGTIAIAFLPVLLRGTLWFPSAHRPLNVHRLGFSELGQAVLFGALLCAAFLK